MNIVSTIPLLGWLLISGIFFAAGEFFYKEFALTPNYWYGGIALLMSLLAALTWMPALLQKNELSITGALWSVIALLVTVLLGVLIFGEKPGLLGVVGILFGFISVFLLSLS